LTVQVNVKLDEKILKEVEKLIERGYVKTKREAFEKALILLLKSYKASEIAEKMDRVREGTELMRSLTEAVIESHEEEDVHGQSCP
jgi:metal-responsive CopG/Arc/MetJ family transcriptional regulator